MRLLPCGATAVLVEVDDLGQVRRLVAAVRRRVSGAAQPWTQVRDVVPAARTVLLTVSAPAGLAGLVAALPALEGELDDGGGVGGPVEEIDIGVRYDGPDLPGAAAHCGLDVAGFVAAHTGSRWQVAFCGFSPGFGYLIGDDPRLDVPRRPTPRTRVPAGSVAMAGRFSGVYPRPSPGGWQLLGRTEDIMWDLARDPASLLRPGVAVRFRQLS